MRSSRVIMRKGYVWGNWEVILRVVSYYEGG